MVMQVLVLAVQNAVEHRFLGVATSGALLFRQVGGAIGVSLFGAIFVNRLHVNLAGAIPPGAHIPKTATPALIRNLPPHVHEAYVNAFALSLQPVFLVAAGIGVVAFVLTWFLREVPLRKHAGVGETAGETFGLEEAA
jgi:hypothetical protein